MCLILMACAIGVTACVNDNAGAGDAESLVGVGDAVPQFSLTATDGSEVSTALLTGQVYILNFFDTRCPDCQEELQVLQRIYETYRDALPMLNVPRSQTNEEVEAYWTKEGLTMPHHVARDKNLYYRFATRVIPRTYVIDGSGKVRGAYSDNPVADFPTLDALLQQLLCEP